LKKLNGVFVKLQGLIFKYNKKRGLNVKGQEFSELEELFLYWKRFRK
jgi:hypothetical protein